MSRRVKNPMGKSGSYGVKKVAEDKFNEVVPGIVSENKEKFDGIPEDELQKNVVAMGNDLMATLQAELPDYKIITHAMVFQKGECPLYDAWCTRWEVDKDGMALYKDETPKNYIVVYGLFYPLKGNETL